MINYKIKECLKDIQLEELKMIEYIDKKLTEKNIWYSLSYGSVLGAVRHGGFIPWDNDIDIMIKIEDAILVREILCEDLPSNMQLLSYKKDTTGSHDILSSKDRLSNIDIYPLIGVPNNYSLRKKFIKKCSFINRIFRAKKASIKRVRGNFKKMIFLMTKFFLMFFPDRLIRKVYSRYENMYPVQESNYLCILSTDGNIGECIEKKVLYNVKRVSFEHLEIPIPVEYDKYLSSIYGIDYMKPMIRKSNYVDIL